MDVIYVVVGHTGGPDDYYTWNVCAYVDEQKAVDHAKRAEEYMSNLNYLACTVEDVESNPWDRHARMYGPTGTWYEVMMVDMRMEVPTVN